ncbi:MAG: lipopolysaccharide assembly protein LapA domain-containing protein [Bacteroidota bacterium]
MAEKKEESFYQKYKKEIFIGTIALLTLVFIVQNSEQIPFQVVFFTINISIIFLITFFFAMGALTVWIKYYFTLKEKNKKIKQLEEELKKAGHSSASVNPSPVTPPPVTPPPAA